MQVMIGTITGSSRSRTEDLPLGADFVIVSTLEGTLGRGEQVALDLSVVLVGQHGAVVDVQQGR